MTNRLISRCDPDGGECRHSDHTSMDCYPKYRQLEDEGQGYMTYEEWTRV